MTKLLVFLAAFVSTQSFASTSYKKICSSIQQISEISGPWIIQIKSLENAYALMPKNTEDFTLFRGKILFFISSPYTDHDLTSGDRVSSLCVTVVTGDILNKLIDEDPDFAVEYENMLILDQKVLRPHQ